MGPAQEVHAQPGLADAATERCPILLAEFLTEGMTFLNYRFIPFGEGMTNVELTFLKARSNTRPAVRELYDFFSRRGGA